MESYKHFLNENSESVSVQYLKGLLKNTSNTSAKKYLKSWISRGGVNKMVKISRPENVILDLIKKGGPFPKDFSYKN